MSIFCFLDDVVLHFEVSRVYNIDIKARDYNNKWKTDDEEKCLRHTRTEI